MIQTLVIPDWHPTSVNELVGCGIRRRSKLKRSDRDLVGVYARQQGIKPATGPRHVGVLITLGPGERACDPDNYWKSLLDALKNAGLLVDDRRQMVTTDTPEFDRGPSRKTTIQLTDVEPVRKR